MCIHLSSSQRVYGTVRYEISKHDVFPLASDIEFFAGGVSLNGVFSLSFFLVCYCCSTEHFGGLVGGWPSASGRNDARSSLCFFSGFWARMVWIGMDGKGVCVTRLGAQLGVVRVCACVTERGGGGVAGVSLFVRLVGCASLALGLSAEVW